MSDLKEGTWLHDLVFVYNALGGQAPYSDVYELAKRRRQENGGSWTKQSAATIRRTVEDHAESSSNFRGRSVFYSVSGHGKGVWALKPEYISHTATGETATFPTYLEGIEGIVQERRYLLKSRDAHLVEARRALDGHACQSCGFRLELPGGKFIIEVHHLNPIGELKEVAITSVNDLVCLCPTCHRVAHSGAKLPLPIAEIKMLMGQNRV